MMEKLVLLLMISVAGLCDAGPTHNKSSEFRTSAIEEPNEEAEMSCGMINSLSGRHSVVQKHITIGETDIKYMKFPWMVKMFASKSKGELCALMDDHSCWQLTCVGSLISSKVVLTVGRCVDLDKQNQMKARAGERSRDTIDELLPYQERLVVESIVHPRYHHAKWLTRRRYDVALFVVETPFTSTSNIGFICLPPPDLNVTSARCTAVTNGNADFGYQNAMDVNYVDRDDCEKIIREARKPRFSLHDSFTCAEHVRFNDTRRVAWGSLLMCIADDHYYARGINAWFFSHEANRLDIYADIVKVRNWIDQEMKARGFTTDTYTHVAHRK